MVVDSNVNLRDRRSITSTFGRVLLWQKVVLKHNVFWWTVYICISNDLVNLVDSW